MQSPMAPHRFTGGARPVMIVVAVTIAAAWGLLLGTAYVCRTTRRSRATSAAAVTACFGVLAAAALIWLGWRPQGWLGATGMLLPATIAMVLATRPNAR